MGVLFPALSGVGLAEGLVPVSGLVCQSSSSGKLVHGTCLLTTCYIPCRGLRSQKGGAFRIYFVETDRLERPRSEWRKCT